MELLRKHLFFTFMIVFALYYLVFVNRDPHAVFFTLATIAIAYKISYQKEQIQVKKKNDVKAFMKGLEKDLSWDHELSEKNFYQVHKTPRSLKYLLKKDEYVNIIYDLRFLNTYDKPTYHKLVSLANYFLKIHYNTMLGKYDFDQNLGVLKDIRNEMLNCMSAAFFNVPKVSKILDIPDIDSYLKLRTRRMQAITYRYMKTIYHKFTKSRKHTSYYPPFEHDPSKDSFYELY